ncbi:MAG: PAS domain S-box protein [Luteitalea sp.]|nr:PAS domain S-box protein [Luteitalea sp.]
MLREVPPGARWYILAVIALGALTFALLIRHATFTPVGPLLLLIVLSSLFSAFKVQFPIASGSNMSLSYIVDIAALILRGPHAAMIVGAASGWSQSTFKVKVRNPLYRTLFNMACLILTAQASGQVFQHLGGTPVLSSASVAPLLGMAVTYFIVNTVPIAIAIALTTDQSAWGIWKTDFASSAANYIVGAIAAVVVIEVTETSGYWLTLLLAAAPLYLTYRMYRNGVATEARQGAILEAAHDAIITMDQHLNIREFNPAAEHMFGYDRMQILGRNVDFLLPLEERDTQVGHLTQYMVSGDGPLAGRQLEMSALRADGTLFPVELTVARVSGDRSALITGFVRDATERHALEEQLRQSQKLEAIGRLAGGVAHDFNNVLMSIMGSADLLLMEVALEHGARAEVTEIKESVRRGASLTRQLLAFSRRQATSPRVFELGEVVAGMDTMLRRLMGPEIQLEIARGSRVTVMADPVQMEQVVLNLVINARDAMPQGGRLVISIDEVTLDDMIALSQADCRPGQYARLSVSDTGSGIDEQTRARMFEPFFTTKAHDKGTGLGLSIVYGIVKQNGGHITVLSEPGRGAMFVIHLPAVVVTEPSTALA